MPDQKSTRNRLVWTFFSGVAIGRTGFILAITVASLAGGALASTRWSGLPSALATAGVAAGALMFSAVANRYGRTVSFTSGYATAAAGCGLAAVGVVKQSFALLLLGMAILGLGQATSHLARYAAADLQPASRRATVIGLIVWAGTIGAVIGPKGLEPAGNAAIALGLDDLAGPLLGGAALFGLGALMFVVFLRPDPAKLAIPDEVDSALPVGHGRSRRELLKTHQTRLALIAMALGQGIMVLIMTQTPLHLRRIGEGLDTIGSVMTAHTLGMFAIAPLTGFLVTRIGTRRMIAIGAIVLALSTALSLIGAEPERSNLLLPGLLVLGIGWNFTFVAGSTHLTAGLTFQERLNIQGMGDTLTWVSGGTASILSGVVVSATSYASLSLIGGVAALVPLVALVALRQRSLVTA